MTEALRLPVAERACRATVLAADLAVLDTSNSQIHQAEQQLAVVLPNTPAGVLTTPGASVVGPPTTAQPWRPRPLRQRPADAVEAIGSRADDRHMGIGDRTPIVLRERGSGQDTGRTRR